MEEKKETVEETQEETVQQENEGTGEKLLTQEEFDKAIQERVAREKKKLPPKEELDEFKKWKEGQKTQEEKLTEIQKIMQEKEEKLSNLEKENLLLKKGIPYKNIDYLIFQASKMDGDFSENVETFLKENPEFSGKKETKDTGVTTTGVKSTQTSGIEAILRQRNPEIYN
jgi:serine phosphatase RsbU (regulator of sigma subunit)